MQFRGADGAWHELHVDRKHTGDPELDAIWEMSLGELETILDDESHVLHGKAKIVSEEMVRPFSDALQEIVRPISEAYMSSIDTSGLAKAMSSMADYTARLPKPDTSWFSRFLVDVSKNYWEMPLPGIRTESPVAPSQSDSRVSGGRAIDLEGLEPPDATLAEIQEVAQARADELRSRQVQILGELLAEARASASFGNESLLLSRQALQAANSSKRAGWIAAWAAMGAVLVGLVGILVTRGLL